MPYTQLLYYYLLKRYIIIHILDEKVFWVAKWLTIGVKNQETSIFLNFCY